MEATDAAGGIEGGISRPVPQTTQSNFQLTVRYGIIKLSDFNVIKLGPETPIAPGRGEKASFGERFGHSFRSRSPESISQTRRKPGVFQAVSPVESGSLPGWWRRIGNRDRTLSVRREAGRW